MDAKGNTQGALAVVRKLEAGQSIAEVLRTERVEVEIEVLPGVTALVVPTIEEDGQVHLAGVVESAAHGEFKYHFSASPEDVERLVRDAIENHVPLRVARWFSETFNRTPKIARVLSAGPKREGTIGPRRLLRRQF